MEENREFSIIIDGGTEIEEITEEDANQIMETSKRWHGYWSCARKDKITHALVSVPKSDDSWDETEPEALAVKIDGEWWDWGRREGLR